VRGPRGRRSPTRWPRPRAGFRVEGLLEVVLEAKPPARETRTGGACGSGGVLFPRERRRDAAWRCARNRGVAANGGIRRKRFRTPQLCLGERANPRT